MTKEDANFMYNGMSQRRLIAGVIRRLFIDNLGCIFQRLAFFKPWPMRQANNVRTILGFTSTKSSGSA